jgi:hypothetical protein
MKPTIRLPGSEGVKHVIPKIYKGNCHCGAFKISIKIPACAKIFYTAHIR